MNKCARAAQTSKGPIAAMAVVLTFCLSAFSANHLYMFGGSGDDPETKNLFTRDFEGWAQFAKRNDWSATIRFDGEHPRDFRKVQRIAPQAEAMSPRFLEAVRADIKTGKIKAGDQVLIKIETHGIPNQQDEHTHSVSCGPNNDFCSLDELRSILLELEGIGAKPAVIDSSCFSGASLALATEKTCVVTGAPTNDVALGAFSAGLKSGLRKGRSLEELFLFARSRDLALGNPQISSPAGNYARERLGPISDRVKVNPGLPVGPIANNQTHGASGCLDCLQSQTPAARSESILENLTPILESQIITELENAKTAYDAIRNPREQLAQSIFEDAERLTANCGGEYTIPWNVFKNPPLNLDRSTKTFRECYQAGKAKFDTDPASKTLPERVAELQRLTLPLLNSRINLNLITGRVSRDEPEARAMQNFFQIERRAYETIYKNHKSEEPNPCASFVL